MQLYYYRDPRGNFGDDLNPWLWPKLLPGRIDSGRIDDTLLVGIGTLLNNRIPEEPSRKLVYGTGAGYKAVPKITRGWKFFCVRGPLTAQALALPKGLAVTDGAVLVRQFVEPANHAVCAAAFMPHHRSAQYGNWKSLCGRAGIKYIDPASPVENTIHDIRTTRLLITEAMHGAIVADALRVPWIPVRTNRGILEFKWQDWMASLAMEHRFEWLPALWDRVPQQSTTGRARAFAKNMFVAERLSWLSRFTRPRLSSEKVFSAVYSRMLGCLEELRTWQ